MTGRVASARLGVVVDPATKQYGGFINHTWTRTYMGGAFVQDRWRIKPNLTVNFGLRWEGQGDMYDVEGITAIPSLERHLRPFDVALHARHPERQHESGGHHWTPSRTRRTTRTSLRTWASPGIPAPIPGSSAS